jgi:hypothetical protein
LVGGLSWHAGLQCEKFHELVAEKEGPHRVVAFVTSFLLVTAGFVLVYWYSKRRPVGTPLTWGEAMAAAAFAYLFLFFAYGVVPHSWLAYADNELSWRSDKILNGPGNIVGKLPFTVSYQVLRDIIAATIYIVFLSAQIAIWAIWQGRGKTKPKEIETSSYGRPLVKRA